MNKKKAKKIYKNVLIFAAGAAVGTFVAKRLYDYPYGFIEGVTIELENAVWNATGEEGITFKIWDKLKNGNTGHYIGMFMSNEEATDLANGLNHLVAKNLGELHE